MANEKKTGFNLLLLVISYWKTLLVVAVATAALSFLLSTPYFIKPKYKSSVIMFPTSSNAVSQLVLADGNYNEFLDVTQFGNDLQINQMIQILQSREIKDHLIERFDLICHYDIDTTSKYWKTKLYKYVDGNVTFSRTHNLAVEISVEDDGPGIPAEERDRIFEAFYTTKEKGAGLGLAVAKKAAVAHGGRLELKDAPKGCRFVLSFPLKESRND